MPRLFGFSAIKDQAAAGAIMWVLGAIPFIIPATIIALQCLQSTPRQQPAPARREPISPSLEALITLSRRISFGGRRLRRRFSTRTVEAMSFLLIFACAGLGLAYLASSSSDDDDQVLRLHQPSGPFEVSVFAPSGDLETGPSDFNVLVQDRNTQEVLLDSTVDLHAEPKSSSSSTQSVRATTDAENKLLQTASLHLPAAGDWTLAIAVTRGEQRAEFSLPLRVIPPEAGFALPWSYLVLIAFSGLLLFSYTRRHRKAQTRASAKPASSPMPEPAPAKKLIY
jgi:hypothetical protein